MQPVTRLYANSADADAAVAELDREGFDPAHVHVVRQNQEIGVADLLRKAGISGANAGLYEEHLAAGATLVAVRAIFGQGQTATDILERHGPLAIRTEAEQAGIRSDDPAPLSTALGWKVLSHDPAPLSAMLGLKILSRDKNTDSTMAGLHKLSGQPAPLSHAAHVPLLSADPAPLSSAAKLPVLSAEAAPLSARMKMPVLSKEAAPLSARLGMSTLSNEPAPLSKLLGLPVLLRSGR